MLYVVECKYKKKTEILKQSISKNLRIVLEHDT